jgi:hypothetical protein
MISVYPASRYTKKPPRDFLGGFLNSGIPPELKIISARLHGVVGKFRHRSFSKN